MPMTFFTIGYERTTLPLLIAALRGAGVRRLIDVRDVAGSRKAGFEKRMLAATLDEAGVSYVHLRALGTPKSGRIANRAGDMAGFWRIYEARLAEPDAQLALQECSDLVRSARSVLMCYCAKAEACHRHRIAEALTAEGLIRVDLNPALLDESPD